MAHKKQQQHQQQRASLGLASAFAIAALAAAAAALPGAAAARPLIAPLMPAAPSSPSHYHHHVHYDHHQHHHDESGGGSNVATKGLFGATGCDNGNPSDLGSDDKVGNWYKNCADSSNVCAAKAGCVLWTEFAKPASDKGFAYTYTHTNQYRTKIIPTVALQGLENIVVEKADAATDSLWATALNDVHDGTAGVDKADHAIAWINSLNARTHHQLHIHVGEPSLAKTFFECAKAELSDPPTSWTPMPKSDACNKLSEHEAEVDIRVKLVPKGSPINAAIRDDIHKLASEGKPFTEDPGLLHTGVLVAPHGSGGHIVFLIKGSRVNDITIFGN